MPQLNWTYYSLTGLPYLIELYHGDVSGHVVIFVNGEIVQIDFEQLESTSYSFLIEQQLIDLEINKEDEKFEYIVTPQSPPAVASEDPEIERKYVRHIWIGVIALLSIINLWFLVSKL